MKGEELWNAIEDELWKTGRLLIADPHQEKTYHPTVLYDGIYYTVEDSSTTRWLDEEGNLVRVGEEPIKSSRPIESFRIEIIDFSL